MIKILTMEDTKKLLKMDEVIAAIEMGYREKAMGDAVVFPMVSYEFDSGKEDMEVGEMEKAYKRGLITKNSIAAEIGEIIAGRQLGRTSEDEITAFDSTGISLQDISVGALALKKADEMKLGQEIAF